MDSRKISKSISIIPIHDFNLSDLPEDNLNENFWEFSEFGDEERDRNIDQNNVAEKISDNAVPTVKKRSRGRPKKKKNSSSMDDNGNNTTIHKIQNKNKKTYSKKKGKLIQKKINVVKEGKTDSNQIEKGGKPVTGGSSRSISSAEHNKVSESKEEVSKNNIELNSSEIRLGTSMTALNGTDTELGRNKTELNGTDIELGENGIELSRNNNELSRNNIELRHNEVEASNGNNKTEMGNLNFNSNFKLNINNENRIQVCASSINIEDQDYHEQVSKVILPSSLTSNLEIDDNEITKVDNDNLSITNNSDLDKLETFFSEYKLKMLKIEEKITEKFQMEIRNHRHNVAKQVAQLIDVFKSQSVAGAGYGGQ